MKQVCAQLCKSVQVCPSLSKYSTPSTKLLLMFPVPIAPINIVSKASYGIFKCHASLAKALKTESLAMNLNNFDTLHL